MTAAAILDTLRKRGAVVQPNGDRIRVVPSQVLDNELRAAIRAERAALLDLLTASTFVEPEPAPRSIMAADVYDAAQATAHANRERRLQRITEAQRDTLLEYAEAFTVTRN